MEKLRELLKEYSIGLKYFKPSEEDDAALLYAVRENLEQIKNELSSEELKKLAEADDQALKLWERYKYEKGDGVFYLELLVKNFVLKPVKTA